MRFKLPFQTEITNRLAAAPDYMLLTIVLGLLVIFRAWLTYIAHLELHFDEALYWEYAQHLDWSYYEKGPVTAYAIALFETIFGTGEWQVRLAGWLASSAFCALVFYFTRDVWQSRRAAWWSVVLIIFTPTYFSIGLAMTPDNFLWCFWTWGLWSIYKALFAGNRFAWYQTGAAVGLGALSKLSIGLLPAFVALWMIAKKSWRHHFKNPHLWWALLLMIFIMSPLIYWNSLHDWGSLRHEQGHISSHEISFKQGLEFLFSQLLIMSPIVMVLAIFELRKKPADEKLFFLWVLTIAWVLFFLVKAMSGKIQVNWPAASYISFIVLFAGTIHQFSVAKLRILFTGIVFSILFMFVYYFPSSIGLNSAKVATIAKMKAWREPITTLSQEGGDISFLLTSDYVIASELAFYWPHPIHVYVTGNQKRRYNQHDFWPSINREEGKNGLYVDIEPKRPALLDQAFESCAPLQPVKAVADDGSTVRVLYAYFCKKYRPIQWPKPGYY